MLLPLGGEDSLRGYPEGSYQGDQRQLLVLEQRYLSDAHWFNLIRVGAAAFVETGRTLLGENRDPDSPWLTDAGIGLRLSSSKALSGTVVHLDLAFPMTDWDKYAPRQWTVTTKETFQVSRGELRDCQRYSLA
jgi:hemolysin activation/secretion protein